MKRIKKWMPFAALLAALAVNERIPNSALQPEAEKPYFSYFLIGLAVLYAALLVCSLKSEKIRDKTEKNAPFYAGMLVLLTAINLAVSKFALLPVLFFPSLDRIFGVFAADYALLAECILASGKLLLTGFGIGAALGFLTGVLTGFHKKAEYWITPLMKFIGPIPPTSWSPLVLSLFTKTYSAAVFMVALAVWFPITLMTYNGVQNVDNAYFEVAATLGGGRLTEIVHVGIPAAMPSVFLGIFYATCSAFVTLVTAELLGAEAGLGWYLNWEKSMMLYANVYAGLILIAVICTLAITLVFRIRDKVLVWQKGVIKW